MSTTTPHLFRRTVLIGLIIAMLMTTYTLILAPGVSAASDATKTETNSENIVSTEDSLLTQRAIMIDEARKEAKEVVSEQIAIQEAKAATEAPTEAASDKPQNNTSASAPAASTPSASQPGGSSNSSESSNDGGYTYADDEDYYSEGNAVSASGSGDYLLDIDVFHNDLTFHINVSCRTSKKYKKPRPETTGRGIIPVVPPELPQKRSLLSRCNVRNTSPLLRQYL